MFIRRPPDHELLGHDLFILIRVSTDTLLQQVIGHTSHLVGLILYGRHLRGHIPGMLIVSKADQRHILWDAQSHLLDGSKGCEGNGIIDGQDCIRSVLNLQKLLGGLYNQVEVYPVTHHQSR